VGSATGAHVRFESFDDGGSVGRGVSVGVEALHDPPAHQRGGRNVTLTGEFLHRGQLVGVEPQGEHHRLGPVRSGRPRVGWDRVVAVLLGVLGFLGEQPL